MQIVVSKHESVFRSLSFTTDVISVGSDPDAQISLPDGRIAAHQADLRNVDGTWVVDPLDLQHALILNAIVAETRTPLKNGDEIRLGDFALRIYVDTPEEAAPVKTAITEELAKIRQHALPAGSITRKEEAIRLAPDAKARTAALALRLAQCTEIAGLLNVSAAALLDAFSARLVWIGMRRQNYGDIEFIDGIRKDGRTVNNPPHLDTFVYRCLERDQFILVPRTEEKDTTSVLAVPLLTDRGCVGLVYVDSAAGATPYDEPHLDELMMHATLLTRQFEAIVAEQARHQAAVTDVELAFVRAVQARMDPATVPQWEQLQVAAYSKPGTEHSGDLLDVMRLPNGLAAFIVAHAEAANTRAALAMAEVRTAFRMAAMHADPPHILARALNWMLRTDREPCLLHAAIIVMNPKSGACEYATAGNIGAIIVDDTGEPRVLADAAVKPLGSGSEHNLPARTARLAANETLVFYSPGCRSAEDAQGTQLGDGPLLDALCDGFGQSAAAALDEVLADLGDFLKEKRQRDDITMLFVHRI